DAGLVETVRIEVDDFLEQRQHVGLSAFQPRCGRQCFLGHLTLIVLQCNIEYHYLIDYIDMMSEKTIKNPLYVGSVGKAFRVLDCFKSAPGDLSLSEMVER